MYQSPNNFYSHSYITSSQFYLLWMNLKWNGRKALFNNGNRCKCIKYSSHLARTRERTHRMGYIYNNTTKPKLNNDYICRGLVNVVAPRYMLWIWKIGWWLPISRSLYDLYSLCAYRPFHSTLVSQSTWMAYVKYLP